MKGKQCVVTPQNYYWMKKKKITTEKVKNNLAVAHVFKWLEWPAITRAMNEARRTLFMHLSHITSSRAVLLTLMSNLHLYSIPCLTFSPSVAPQVTFEIDKWGTKKALWMTGQTKVSTHFWHLALAYPKFKWTFCSWNVFLGSFGYFDTSKGFHRLAHWLGSNFKVPRRLLRLTEVIKVVRNKKSTF